MFKSLRLGILSTTVAALLPAQGFAAPDCQLCVPPLPASSSVLASLPQARQPLRIEIETMLDFSAVARQDHTAGGITIDPISNARRITGGLVGLGGPAMTGTVRMSGEPFAHVRVDFPHFLTMQSAQGSTVTVSDIETSLSANPVFDANGQLRFSFGAKLTVENGVSGEFLVRFPISVDYQ